MKVTIVYQGGSAGFFLYYYLLLSGQYQYSIKRTWELIDSQFPLILSENKKLWKTKEFWPNNNELIKSPNPSVMLVCNPLFCKDVFEENKNIINNSHAILLKMNFRAQLRMCFEKQSYWFTEVSRKQFSAPKKDSQYIRKIISSQINNYDPEIPRILKNFEIEQIVDVEDLLKYNNIKNFSMSNLDQKKWMDRWYNLQSVKAQKLLKK